MAAGLTIPVNSNIDEKFLEYFNSFTNLFYKKEKEKLDLLKEEKEFNRESERALSNLDKSLQKELKEGSINKQK